MIAQQQFCSGSLSPNMLVPADYFTLSGFRKQWSYSIDCASDMFILIHPFLAFCRVTYDDVHTLHYFMKQSADTVIHRI